LPLLHEVRVRKGMPKPSRAHKVVKRGKRGDWKRVGDDLTDLI